MLYFLVAILLTANPGGPRTTTRSTTLNTAANNGVLMDIPASTVGTTISDIKGGQTISCFRGSTATYRSSSSAIATAGVNDCRIESNGLLIEPTVINRALRSQAMATSPWQATSGLDVTENSSDCGAAPDGTQTATKVVIPAASDAHIVYQSVTASGSNCATTWAKLITPSSASMTLVLGSSGEHIQATVTNSWARTSAQCIGTTNPWFDIGTAFQTTAGFTVCLWGASVNANYPKSYVATAGSPVTQPADIVSVTNPIPTGQDFCVTTTATPEGGGAWSLSGTRYLISIGEQGTANSASLYEYSGVINFVTLSGSSASKQAAASHTFADASSHKITACWLGGVPMIAFDGVIQSSTVTGTGTGIAAQPSTIYLGTGDAVPNGSFGGNLKSIRICKSTGGCL